MSVVVGVDVAKRSFDIATPLPNGKVRTKAKLANNPSGFEQFATWLEQHAEPRAWVIMEATGTYHEALAVLSCQGLPGVYSESRRDCQVCRSGPSTRQN